MASQQLEQQREQHRLQILEAKEDVRQHMGSLIEEATHERDAVKQQTDSAVQLLNGQLKEKSREMESLMHRLHVF